MTLAEAWYIVRFQPPVDDKSAEQYKRAAQVIAYHDKQARLKP